MILKKIIGKSSKIRFFFKSDIYNNNNKKPPAGKLATEVRTGDAPKPQVSTKTYEKLKKTSGNRPPVNHRNFSLFLSLHGARCELSVSWYHLPGIRYIFAPHGTCCQIFLNRFGTHVKARTSSPIHPPPYLWKCMEAVWIASGRFSQQLFSPQRRTGRGGKPTNDGGNMPGDPKKTNWSKKRQTNPKTDKLILKKTNYLGILIFGTLDRPFQAFRSPTKIL